MEVALLIVVIVAQLVILDTTGRGYTLDHPGKGHSSHPEHVLDGNDRR